MVFSDIKNFFNTLWKKLVEVREWDRLEFQGQKWELARQLSEGVTYQADYHGHLTRQIAQKEGLAQGALLSSKKSEHHLS